MNWFFIICLFLSTFYFIFLIRIKKGIKNILKVHPVKENKGKVTVIIPFKNESDNIINSIKSLQAQTYPKEKLEIYYVDDNSTDDSVAKYNSCLKDDYFRLLVVPKEYLPSLRKLRAIKYGIDHANGDIIITTDCDCLHNAKWIESMINTFDQETGFVSGPVKFSNKKLLHSSLQELEFAGLILTGAGLIALNQPVVCNSANIAYRKDLIETIKDRSKNENEVPDESLIIRTSVETNYKVKFCWNADAIVSTEAVSNFKDFWKQRTRWASFNWFHLPINILISLALTFLFYISIPWLLFQSISGSALSLFLLAFSLMIKLTADYFVLREGMKFLFENISIHIFLIAELLHIPYIIISVISGFIFNVKWKEK